MHRRPKTTHAAWRALVLAVLLGCATGCTSTTNSSASDLAAAASVATDENTAAVTDSLPAPADFLPTPTDEPAPKKPDFQPLNPAVGYGFLRVMNLEERPGPRDVVIYSAIPNELPRVAGVITTVEQTPLSHVNLRAIQDKIPNAYIRGAADVPAIKNLIGQYVRYNVTPGKFEVVAATQSEVEKHHENARPNTSQSPVRELSVRALQPLTSLRFQDWTAYGVKAANLGQLHTLDLPAAVPEGFAVPFFYYDEFMTLNGFYQRVEKLLNDPAIRENTTRLDVELKALRKAIRSTPLTKQFASELERVRGNPRGSVRCRSSTNNEDLPGFNGAGLYDSKTQRPEEGPLEKCVKQVYASVWNLRAFLERDFYQINHLQTAMAVIVHPNTDDELANGVAVSTDPVYETPGAYYVNAQQGEELITNPSPERNAIPESLLLDEKNRGALITRSSLITPGTRLLSDAHLANLRTSLDRIHEMFAKLYRVSPTDRFAMEIEFKVRADDSLYIKQARSWVFG